MNLTKIKKAYFVGIKGTGMTALAQVFKSCGIAVVGSDTDEKFFTDEVLEKLNIKVIEKFDKKNISSDIDVVISSAAYFEPNTKAKNTHCEIKQALKQKIPIFTYAQALGTLFNDKYGIAVAGTHGKSTTTAMLGIVLEAAGLDPTVVVGTKVAQWESNSRVGTSKYLIAEADEYRNHFLNYSPKGLVLTNIEFDHPDFFKNFNDYKKSFKRLIQKIPKDGFVAANQNDKTVLGLVKNAKCKIIKYTYPTSKINLKSPGKHNQLNAAAVMAAASELGINEKIIKQALAGFTGISRRFEFKKEKNGIIFIDDFAHHPSEIKATLQAAREKYPRKRIWAVFQPHTFSRTKALLNDFSQSFKQADKVIILDVYASAREKTGKVKTQDLVKKIPNKKAVYLSNLQQAADFLARECRFGDIVLTMGAGDVWRLSTAGS